MALDDKVKTYVDKGVSASKEALSKAGAASKEAFTKAGAAVRDLGDKSVVRLELIQLDKDLKKTYENLALQVYEALEVRKESKLKGDAAAIAGYLSEITRIRLEIERRNNALKTK
jgi:hypothetical protein